MLLKLFLIIILGIFKLSSSAPLSDLFCFPLCATNQCTATGYDKCLNCTSGFKRTDNASSGSSCVHNNGSRLQPIGKTEDITYNLQGPYNMTQLNITNNGTYITPIAQCKKNNDYDYIYYGNLTKTDVINILYTDDIPQAVLYRVRIRFWIITIDDWSDSSQLSVTFLTNITESPKNFSLKQSNMNKTKNVCGGGNKQGYRTIDAEFSYTQFDPPEFQLAIHNNSKNNPWGIKQIVVMIRVCHKYCLICTGDNDNQCSLCDYANHQAKLSGTKCALTCQNGYGNDTQILDVCIQCISNCKKCFDKANNCSECYSNYYLYTQGTNITCVSNCPQHFFENTTGNDFCDLCDSNCLNCSQIPTNCTVCYPGQYLYNNVCYSPCPAQTYADNATQKCYDCHNRCLACQGAYNNCSSCKLSGPNQSYLKNNWCVKQCGDGLFEDSNYNSGPNICSPCDPACTTCDDNSTFCFTCTPTFYYYEYSCVTDCPNPDYFADNTTWTCLQCDTYCVGLETNLFFDSNLKQKLIFQLNFTQDLNWTLTDLQNFVKVSQSDSLLQLSKNFNVSFLIINPRSYQVIVEPKGYIFIYNVTFTFQTIFFNGTIHKAGNYYPFKITNYDRIKTKTWFLIKAPSLSDTQKNIVDSVSKASDFISEISTLPYVQEIKKTGIFSMLLGGAQATSMACLVNNIPSQNFYEGVRIFSSFVFFNVPQWEQNSDKTKFLVSSKVQDVVKDARLLMQNSEYNDRMLFDTSSIEWRFQRTGYTTFFIFDVYINIVLVVLCWILLLIGKCCIKNRLKYKSIIGKFWSLTHKIHEISIFYITLTTLLEWIYFDASSLERWISFGICILFNCYFLFYELYIYYDMINYPKAKIGNEAYEYYCLRYGSLLKNIRFEQYDAKQSWSFKHWFRPYNYHILSYYKKFLMMISLPIFYGTPHAQVFVLLTIQMLQILRFLIVWPFKSKIRNIIRLTLDICLMGFFVTVLIQGFMVQQIMINDPNTIENSVNLFYKIGWAGFILVFVFNIGHVLIIIFDLIIGCRKTNKQLMDQARKIYYMQRLNTYEIQNEDVPLDVVNKWVKLGNLNNRNYDQLPQINLRLQYFKIYSNKNGYYIEMKKILEIYMNIEFNFHEQNNMSAGKKLNKNFTLTKAVSPQFYNLIDGIYSQYKSQMELQSLTIKTFQKIDQSALKPGQQIELKPSQMTQKIQLETYAGQTKQIILDKLLPGFPISKDDLIHLI